jgi:hypothetical protein
LSDRLRAREQPSGRRGTPFRPWKPVVVPGSYDPALDAEERAAERGYGDLVLDSEKIGERAGSQLEIDTGNVKRTGERSLADILRERGRAKKDFATRREDTSLGYRRLGSAQAQASAAQGVIGGGTLAAALQARTANESVDQGRITESENRFMEDSTLSEGRVGEDTDLALADIGRLYGYGVNDRTDALAQAFRELGFFETDTAEQRAFQAGQSGLGPQRPANEFLDAKGAYRIVKKKGVTYKKRPDGTLERVGGSQISGGPAKSKGKKKSKKDSWG